MSYEVGEIDWCFVCIVQVGIIVVVDVVVVCCIVIVVDWMFDWLLWWLCVVGVVWEWCLLLLGEQGLFVLLLGCLEGGFVLVGFYIDQYGGVNGDLVDVIVFDYLDGVCEYYDYVVYEYWLVVLVGG